MGRVCEDCGQAKRQEVEAGLPVTWKENLNGKRRKKKKRHSWWIPHQAVLLTEMRESYLASEINKSVWIQKNSAGNGISTKFKISKCEWQLLTDVRPLFVFWNIYRFHFHLFFFFLYVLSLFSGEENLYTISSMWQQCDNLWDDMTRKNSVYCCCRFYLVTEWNVIEQPRW